MTSQQNFFRRNKTTLLAVFISVACYLLFFGLIFKPNTFFSGSDVDIFYLPSRIYLYDSIVKEHRFPFWTEKMLAGFPIYADAENGYLNPLNLVSLLLLGPINSYKFLHIFSYLVGSISLFLFLKRKGLGLITFTVTNLIYYFSFFSLDHSIHFNIVLTFFLLPLSLLLVDKYFETNKNIFIYLCAFSIINGVYWGHMQTVVIYTFTVVAYAIFFYIHRIKKLLFYLITLGIITISLSLPQLYPTYLLYKNSHRGTLVDYTKGSLTPYIAPVTIYPFIFGRWQDYTARKIIKEYTYTETYIYLGISLLISVIFGIIFNKKDKLFYFSFFLIVLFLILGFIRYLPFFSPHLPIISWFRYWQRVIFASSLGVGIIAGTFLEKGITANKKSVIIGFLLLLSVITYFLLLNFFNQSDPFLPGLSKAVNLTNIKNTFDFKVWKIILILSISLNFINLVFSRKYKTLFYVSQLALCLLFIYDLKFFGNDVIFARTGEIKNLVTQEIPEVYNSKRILLDNHKIDANLTLLYKPWFLTGYSQFVNEDYYNYYYSTGASNINRNVVDNPEGISFSSLRKAKVFAYLDVDSNQYSKMLRKEGDLGLFEPLTGKYLIKHEGYIKAETDFSNPEYAVVNTGIKNDAGWKIKINDKEVKSLSPKKLFISLKVPGGRNIIEFYYIPYPFYYALTISVFLNFIIIILLRKLSFPNEKILKAVVPNNSK